MAKFMVFVLVNVFMLVDCQIHLISLCDTIYQQISTKNRAMIMMLIMVMMMMLMKIMMMMLVKMMMVMIAVIVMIGGCSEEGG